VGIQKLFALKGQIHEYKLQDYAASKSITHWMKSDARYMFKKMGILGFVWQQSVCSDTA
jgi:hypothetical protein